MAQEAISKPALFETPRALSATQTKPAGFRFLLFNVSRACNHRCPFCWTSEALKSVQRQSKPDAVDWFSDEIMTALFNAFKNAGGEVIAIMADGEPLLGFNYQFLKRVALNTTKQKLGMLIFTNGELLDEKTMAELSAMNRRIAFSISIDAGNEERYEQTHGVKGAYGRVMKNKEAWLRFDAQNKKENFHRIAIHTVISALINEDEMETIKRLVKELGDVPWIVSTLGMAGDARLNEASFRKDAEETKKLIEKYSTGPTAFDPKKHNCSYIVSEWHGNSMYGITFHPFNNGAIQPCPYLSSFGSAQWFSLRNFVEERKPTTTKLAKEIDSWLKSAVMVSAITTTAAFKVAGYNNCIMRHKNLATMESFFAALNIEMSRTLTANIKPKASEKNYLEEIEKLAAKNSAEVAKYRFGKEITIDIEGIRKTLNL